MTVTKFKILCTEIFKTLINPTLMKDLLKSTVTKELADEKCKMNLTSPKYNQIRFGRKSQKYFVWTFGILCRIIQNRLENLNSNEKLRWIHPPR